MATNNKILPRTCPSCGDTLAVTRFLCRTCATAVEGDFELPVLAKLDPQEQAFVLAMIEESGSLKGLAQRFSVSYPTVRNRLDALRAKIKALQAQDVPQGEDVS